MRAVEDIRKDLALFDDDGTDIDDILRADSRLLDDIPDLLAEVKRLRTQLPDLWICNHAATCDVKPTEFDGGPCPHKVPHRRGREFTTTDCYCMWYVDAECVLVEDGGSDD